MGDIRRALGRPDHTHTIAALSRATVRWLRRQPIDAGVMRLLINSLILFPEKYHYMSEKLSKTT